MIIRHNESGTDSIRVHNSRQSHIKKNIQQLSTGFRINSAGDNPASFTVSEKLRGKISGLKSAKQNALDGLSLVQTTEGYLQGVQSLLTTAKALAVQSANGVYADSDRASIQVEFAQILQEIDRVQSSAEFNGRDLLKGDFANPESLVPVDGVANATTTPDTEGAVPPGPMSLLVGVNPSDTIDVYIQAFNTEKLGLKELKLDTDTGAKQAIQFIDKSIDDINKQRVALGSYQLRLDNVVSSTDIAISNFQAAESNIRNTDIAEVVSTLSQELLLDQINIAMISQANVQAQSALRLIS